MKMNGRKRKIVIPLLAMVFVTGVFSLAQANSTYSGYFNSAYPSSSLAGAGNCAVCHTSVPNLNPYGSDFKSHGKNQAALTAIASLDSDGDGSNNKVEIDAGTFPGDSSSHPVVSDTVAPTVTAFSLPPTSASLTVSITTFAATDNVGVTGYLVTESAVTPSASAAGWNPSAPASYTFSTAGAKTLYAWAEDAAGNISTSRSASVNVTLPPTSDTVAPTVIAFSLPATSASLTVSITTFTATDNVGVTGYMVTETAATPSASATGWSPSAPSAYIFTTSGTKTLHAWAKDAAGNVSSSLSANVTVTGSNPQPPVVDLTLWSGQWLKVTVKYAGYSVGLSNPSLVQQNPMPAEEDATAEMSKDNESVVAYLKLSAWDPQQNVLLGELYQRDSKGQWVHAPLTFHFIDGTRTDFLCWSQVSGDFSAGFTARLQGKESAGILKSGSFKTLGGYYIEIDSTSSASSSQAFSGGQLSINGSLVPRAKIPVPDNALAQ
jgi:hypothetical protein